MSILNELVNLCNTSTDSSKKLELLNGLESEEDIRLASIRDIITKIRDVESHQEYNISLEQYEKILKEKDIEDHVSHLFSDDITVIKDSIMRLRDAIRSNNRIQELSCCKIISDSMTKINNEQGIIQNYLKDISNLKYDIKYISKARVVAKIIKGAAFRVRVDGLDNIPSSGPCILAPHHINSRFDPILLNSVVPRRLFYLSAVDPFLIKPLVKMYNKVGALPFKRVDSQYGKVIEGLPSEEKLNQYPSSNKETIINFLKYLKYGEATVIFPEGDTKYYGRYVREDNADFIKLQPGLVTLAILSANQARKPVKVIPVGIKYNGSGLFHGLFTSVDIRIGVPIMIAPSGNAINGQRNQLIEGYNGILFNKIKELSM